MAKGQARDANSARTGSSDSAIVNRLFTEALTHGAAYRQLRTVTAQSPGRISGSPALQRAIVWAERVLSSAGP
jgi:hypothetical protein